MCLILTDHVGSISMSSEVSVITVQFTMPMLWAVTQCTCSEDSAFRRMMLAEFVCQLSFWRKHEGSAWNIPSPRVGIAHFSTPVSKHCRWAWAVECWHNWIGSSRTFTEYMSAVNIEARFQSSTTKMQWVCLYCSSLRICCGLQHNALKVKMQLLAVCCSILSRILLSADPMYVCSDA